MSPGHGERRPWEEAAHETPTKKSSPKGNALDCLDAIHHAWLVGYDQGYAEGRQHASEAMAHALLSEQAAVMAGTAAAIGSARHGHGWASEIRQQSEVD